MQYIQTHARGAKFSTYYNPPNHPQSSSSCGRHDQHKQHSILPQTTTQTNCNCTQTALLVLSLFVSLFRVDKHYILLSSCKALLLPATTLVLVLLLPPATPLLLLLLLLLLPATSLVVLLYTATTLLLLLLLLLPATTNLVLQLLQSKKDSSKQSKLATSPTNAKARKKQKDKFPVTKCLPHKCMHGNTNYWLAGWMAGACECNFVCLFVCLFWVPMQCCCNATAS